MADASRYVVGVMSGAKRDPLAWLMRGLLRAVVPFYRRAVGRRNWRFDRGLGVRHLPRPVVSVGNITAGGTGKTPMVAWLAQQLQQQQIQPAVLTRGYKGTAPDQSDEADLLKQAVPGLVVTIHRDRWTGGDQTLIDHPHTGAFILDDGFQHRRLNRQFDLVLVSATQPFGFDHLIPRGLLREPPANLSRASAIVITRSDHATPEQLEAITQRIRTYTAAPVFRACHTWTGLRGADQSASAVPNHAMEELTGKRIHLLAGIADPESVAVALRKYPIAELTTRWHADHHAYAADTVQELTRTSADWIVTTEKDWVKLRHLPGIDALSPRIKRLALDITFAPGDGEQLRSLIIESFPPCWRPATASGA